MTRFVLDASVAMRWLLPTKKKSDQDYADAVLQSLHTHQAIVPNLWHLEVTNVLLSAIKREDLSETLAMQFMQKLNALPIVVDPHTFLNAFNKTYHLALNLNLSAYDAAYLALAKREKLAIATLDTDLKKASQQASIVLHTI